MTTNKKKTSSDPIDIHKVNFFDDVYDLTDVGQDLRTDKIYSDFSSFSKMASTFDYGIKKLVPEFQKATSFKELLMLLSKKKNAKNYAGPRKVANVYQNFAEMVAQKVFHDYDQVQSSKTYTGYKIIENPKDIKEIDRIVLSYGKYEPMVVTLTKVSTMKFDDEIIYMVFQGNPAPNFPMYFVCDKEIWILGISYF